MNAKQKLTEVLRSKITSKLNEMNSEGPPSDVPGNSNPYGESSDYLPPGIVNFIDGGVHHPEFFPVVPEDDGSLSALNQGLAHEETKMFHEQVKRVAQGLELLHAKGRVSRVTLGDHEGNEDDITHQDILRELFQGGHESKFASHLKDPKNIAKLLVVIEKYPMLYDRYGDYRRFTSRST